jgi:uracil phosphoribosyltransferase
MHDLHKHPHCEEILTILREQELDEREFKLVQMYQ